VFWVVAVTTAGGHLVQFVSFVREKATENICCKNFRHFSSCCVLIAERLFTYHHRKCALSFVFTGGASKTKNYVFPLYEQPDGSLNGPVAVQRTVHCVQIDGTVGCLVAVI